MLNWVYGAKTPDVCDLVEEAIFAAHKYRNRLCELELAKRERHYALLRRLAPAFVAAEDNVAAVVSELSAVREAIQAERVTQRTKTPKGIAHLTKAATEIKERLKTARATLKQAKLDAYSDPAVMAAMNDNAAQHKAEQSAAKAASGLYWGTEAIVKQACGSFSSGAPPRFKRYEGEGQLAVQLQGGLDCDDATRYNTLCYIEDSICHFRIGSDDGRPVFARVPIIQHRPLPKGKIKWVYLERRKIADHVRWSVRFTVDEAPVDKPRDENTWVAVHTGWTMGSRGLRAALWQGSDGARGALTLPRDHCDDYTRLDEIRSSRDINRNETIERLREWCSDQGSLPEWLEEVRPHLHAWRSPQRVAKLILHWRDNRFGGDDGIFDWLNARRKTDKHLWQHERRLSVRIVRRRGDLYRNFAKRLSDQYGVLYFAKIDAKELTENTLPEELERDATQVHRHAKWAAVSDLVRMLEEKFPLHAIAVSTNNLTRQCANCGEIAGENKRKTQCHGCGKTWDCDENALANTITRGEAMQKIGALLDLVISQRDKEQKQKEKLVKMQEANRAAREAKRKYSTGDHLAS